MHTIAVITPVHNASSFIAQCIRSVARSVTMGKFAIEHIIVDDASTDHSWETIQSFAHLEHVRTHRLDHRSGAGHARNFAVSCAQADYVFCLDADDVLFQNSLHTLYQAIQASGREWVYGDFLRCEEDLTYRMGDDYYGHAFVSAPQLLTSLFTGEHFFQQNCLYHKTLFDSVGGFDESLDGAQDFDLFVRFALQGETPLYVPGPLYLHRFHPTNMSKISGREGNLSAHKDDVRRFYAKYQTHLSLVISPEDQQKIELYLQ